MEILNKRKVLASIGLLGAAMIWGLSFVIVKNSTELVPTIYMLAFRFTIAAIVLAIIFHKKFKKINKATVIEGLILGILLFVSYLLQTEGCKYTTAGKNAFLTTGYIIIVPFMYWILSKKRPDSYSFLAAFLALIGVGLLSLQGDFSMNVGDFLTLLCGITFAGHLVGVSHFTKKSDPILLTIVQLSFTAIFSWLGTLFAGGEIGAIVISSELVISMIYLGIFSSAVGFLLQTVGQRYITPSAAALLMATESVFGVIFASVFLSEVMTGRMIVGSIVLLIAIVIEETKLEFLPWRKKETEVNV